MSIKYYVITAALVLYLGGCNQQEPAQEDTEVSSSKIINEPTAVKVQIAEEKSLDYLINSSGQVVSFQSVEIKSKSSGIVNTIQVKNGTKVRQGQTLFTTYNEKEKINLERATLNLEEFKLRYESDLIGFTSEQDSSQLNPEIIKNLKISSGLQKALLAKREAEVNLQGTITKAPFSGVLSNFELAIGSTINVGDHIADLYDHQNLGVTIEVLEIDYPLLRNGQEAEIRVLGNNIPIMKGFIKSINPIVDEQSGLIKVDISINDAPRSSNSTVIPGMHVEVSLKVPSQKQIIVPKSAVVVRSGRHVIFTLENDLAKWNYVEVGKENGREIEVLSGISADSQVITENNLQLSHDAPVKLN